MPRNCDNTMLFTKMALMKINIYSITSILQIYDSSILQLVNDGDEEAEGDECTRRQHEEQDVARLGQQGQTEDAAVAEELTADAEECQTQRESETDAYSVEERGYGRLLGGEALSTSEDDTVDDDQRDEESQGRVDIRQVGLDDHLKDCHEGSNHDDEYGYANLVGGD